MVIPRAAKPWPTAKNDQENIHLHYVEKKYPKLFNPTDINTDQTKVIYSATSLVKQKEPQILIQTVLKNWLYLK